MSKQEKMKGIKISLKENGHIVLQGLEDVAILEWKSTSEGNIKSICITIYKHDANQKTYECLIDSTIAHDGSIYGMNSIARILRDYFLERVDAFALHDKPHEFSVINGNLVADMIPIGFKKKSELREVYMIEVTADGTDGKRCLLVDKNKKEIMKELTKWNLGSIQDMELFGMKFVKGISHLVECPRFGKIHLREGFVKQVYVPENGYTYVIEVRQMRTRVELEK